MAGTLAGQVVVFLAAPVLSRLYTPADFGVLAVFTSVVMVLSTIAALRLEQAVPLPDEEQEAFVLVEIASTVILVSTILALAFSIAKGDEMASAVGQASLAPWLPLAAVAAGVTAGFMVLNQLAVRQGRFVAIGLRNFTQASSTVATQLTLGAAGLRPGGLMLGLVLGQAVGAVGLLRGSGLGGSATWQALRPARLWRHLQRYRSFVLVLTPAGLMNVLGVQIPVVLFSAFYGGVATGWLGLTQRVLWIPVLLLGTAVAQVYVNQAARLARSDRPELHTLFTSASRKLALVGVVCAVPLLVAGPELFGWVFGARWTTAGVYAAYLAPALAIQVVAFPLSQTLIVLDRAGLQLVWDGARLLGVTLSIAVPAALGYDARYAVAVYSLVSCGANMSSWALCWWAVRRP